MKSHQYKKTESTLSLSQFSQFLGSATLQLEILHTLNFSQLAETLVGPSPYVRISQDGEYWDTGLGWRSGSEYIWTNTFELDLDLSRPFTISLCDQEEYGADVNLANVSIPPGLIAYDASHNIYIKLLPEEETVSLTTSMLGTASSTAPMLVLRMMTLEFDLTHSVEVLNHRIVLAGKQPYTFYSIAVKRSDGMVWKVDLRYSQLNSLRNQLLPFVPELAQVSWPKKTRFNWLSCFNSRFSRFSTHRIQHRKTQIEEFLNTALANLEFIKCPALNELLHIAA